jgi:hypothetical protein
VVVLVAMSFPVFAQQSGLAQTEPSLGGGFFSRLKLTGDWAVRVTNGPRTV